MKYLYGIKWCKLGESFIDENIFNTQAEASTYANIEQIQMEYEGWTAFLLTFKMEK
jgi:hypothetical protein